MFTLGRFKVTPGAHDALEAAGQYALEFIVRHYKGDWGDVDPHARLDNDRAVVDGGRIHSAYRTKLGTELWVITEADRRSTTVMLPEDY